MDDNNYKKCVEINTYFRFVKINYRLNCAVYKNEYRSKKSSG